MVDLEILIKINESGKKALEYTDSSHHRKQLVSAHTSYKYPAAVQVTAAGHF